MSPSIHQRERRERAFELKFLVHKSVAADIRDWSRTRMDSDPNATGPNGDQYQITSLYFDTPDLDVYHRKGSYGRSKFRVRRYGDAATVFLERKLKTRGLVSKRRSLVDIQELTTLAQEPSSNVWAGVWYHRRLDLRQLRPICEITYHRTARVRKTLDGIARLTLDEGLFTRRAEGYLLGMDSGQPVLNEDQVIIEMKFLSHLPSLFKELVERFALTPQALSKYRTAAAVLGLAPTQSGAERAAAAIDPNSGQEQATCIIG
jgi:hypothetical protein